MTAGREDCVELLRRLAACASVNPNRQPVTAPPYGEDRLVAILADLLRSWGATTTVTEVWPKRPNLVATFPGRDPGRSLLLEAHTDTVPPDPGTPGSESPVVKDGRMHGRGVCDTKGPMAAMLSGVRRVLDEDGQMPVTVHVAACCDEELGANGAHHLVRSGFRADACVVGEPTGMQIIHMHKGVVRVRITAKGVAAHSSDPSKGVNAIYRMIPVLETLEDCVRPALRRKQHPRLGSPTISVGTIHGGTQVNVVPASCTIEIDRRLIPGEDREEAVRGIVAAIPRSEADFSWEQAEYYPPLEQPTDSPVARALESACRRDLGRAEFAVAPWASDAGVFGAAGMPALLFGPGSIAQAHVADEFIDLADLQAAVGVYAAAIREFAGN